MRGIAQYSCTLSCMFAAGGLIVGFLYDTRALDTRHPVPSVAICMPTSLVMPTTVGWRWLNVGSAGIAGLALVYNILLPTPPLQKAKQKSEGLSAALCSAEFAGHAWTAFNMGWSMLSPKLVCMQAPPRAGVTELQPYTYCRSLSVHAFVVVLTLKQTFGFSPRSIGFCLC